MRVIEIDSATKIVIQVKFVNADYTLSANEKKSEQGELGQRFVDGNFIDVAIEPQPPVETMEEKIARLEQQVQSDNLVIMETLATIFEEIIGGA